MATLGIPQNTIEVLQKYNFNFQKKFGQNFLIDTHVLEKIIEESGITKDDFVLEIGPGIGTMTQYLCENAREVAAVEIDKNLIPILADTLSAYDNVEVINDDILKVDINKYLNYCKFQKELDDKTIKAYKADLEQFITVIGENNPDKEMLNAYLVYLHRMYKQKTVKRKIASVKALFHYLEEEELIEINPFHKVKTKFREEVILPKIIPRDIIEQLLNHLYKERSIKEYSEWRKKIILRDIAVVETLFSTGLRISELCHLQNKYVDLKNGVLCIQGKGGKERYLQIGNNDVLSILNAYKKYFEDEIKKQGYFFVNRYGNALSEQSARSMIHKYAGEIQADINITPHMFRHSFATYLMEEDVNIRYIQKMLGHASITTTQIYTYVTTEKEKEILQTRHPRNKINIGENFDNLVY